MTVSYLLCLSACLFLLSIACHLSRVARALESMLELWRSDNDMRREARELTRSAAERAFNERIPVAR